jgi:hypothetical protein
MRAAPAQTEAAHLPPRFPCRYSRSRAHMGPEHRTQGVGQLAARSRPAATLGEDRIPAEARQAAARRVQALVGARPALRCPESLAHRTPEENPEHRDQPDPSLLAHSLAPPYRRPQNEPNDSTIAVRTFPKAEKY